METSIRKWGNSAGVVLPQQALKDCGAQIGDIVKVSTAGNVISLSILKPNRDLNELVEAITATNKHIDLRFISPEKAF